MDRNMSVGLLVAALLAAVGPQLVNLPSWSNATTPAFIGQVLFTVGGVVAAWLGKSPLKPPQ